MDAVATPTKTITATIYRSSLMRSEHRLDESEECWFESSLRLVRGESSRRVHDVKVRRR